MQNQCYLNVRSKRILNALRIRNCSDLTQYSLFISLDLSTLKVIHSGKIMLNSKRNTYVLTQTDPSCRKLETLCSSITEQK